MTVYCDRLTWRSAAAIARSRPRRVIVLDPLTGSLNERLGRAILSVMRCTVDEADFFTGDLHSRDGVPLFVAASRLAARLSIECARHIVARQPLLTGINAHAGGDMLVLYVARRIVPLLERQVLQIQVADALSTTAGNAVMYLACPAAFDPDALTGVSGRVDVRTYRAAARVVQRIGISLFAVVTALRPYVSRCLSVGSRSAVLPSGKPGVLLTQEEDLGADASYRRQPHWVTPGADLPFIPYVMAKGRKQAEASSPPNVVVLDRKTVAKIDRHAAPDALRRRLMTQVRQCLRAAVTSRDSADATAFSTVIRLLGRARVLAAVARRLDVRAMVFGELYLLDSDAMRLVAHDVGAKTIAYQYSNLGYPNPIMLTTADVMAIWCGRFAALWTAYGFRPGAFAVTGYPYDAAFPLVRPRAREWRGQLEKAGAAFVLCYFDENVAATKYGFTSPVRHAADLALLGQALLADATLGLVFKSQFRRHSPTLNSDIPGPLAQAVASGRVVDLHAGSHRNTVLPSEAAQAADMSIGHVIGGTAALEGVLAGTRAVLIDPSSLKTESSDLYRRANIVFESLGDALQAIERFRQGDPGFLDVGDWTPIVAEFDAHRDGGSARRLSALIESVVAGAGIREAQRPERASA